VRGVEANAKSYKSYQHKTGLEKSRVFENIFLVFNLQKSLKTFSSPVLRW